MSGGVVPGICSARMNRFINPIPHSEFRIPLSRIFPTLAVLSLLVMFAAVALGLSIGDLYHAPSEQTLHIRGVHMLTGTAAALAVVLVHSIVITYFVGTSRWCKEVTETYSLDHKLAIQSAILKRKTFPWAVLGMLAVVGVGALGAASDPGTGRANTSAMAPKHYAGAIAGITLVAWTYYRAWLNIVANQQVIERIVAKVGEIRRQRGLDD